MKCKAHVPGGGTYVSPNECGMHQRFVPMPDHDGSPCAVIPFARIWDLVDFVSYHRVTAMYRYHSTHFSVTFPRSDLESARRILDDWMHAAPRELQPT